MTTLQQLTNVMREHAIKVFAASGRKAEIMPLLHAETADGEVTVIGLPWGNSYEKDVQLAVARRILKRIGAVRYAIVSEAWAAQYTPGVNTLDVSPADREDRDEIVSIIAADRDGNSSCVAYKIERDARGRPSVGSEYKIASEDEFTSVETKGLLLELLED